MYHVKIRLKKEWFELDFKYSTDINNFIESLISAEKINILLEIKED